MPRCSSAPRSTRASGSRPRSTGGSCTTTSTAATRATGTSATLLSDTELWFVLVANPDGYQYTFDGERLWRKNLRDNNGDGIDQRRRRRRPEPQLARPLEVRRGGLVLDLRRARPTAARAPAPSPRRKALKGLLDARRLLVPGQLALGRPVAAVRRGLADRHADRRRPDLLRPLGQPRRAGDPGLPSGPELRRALRHQRRDDGLRARRARHAGVDARAVRGLRGLRLRVPGRRGAGAGRVRAQPAVREVGRRVGGRSGRPGVVARHRDQAVLPRERRPVQGRASRARTSRSTTPTATRSRCRCWPSGASATSRSSTGSTTAATQQREHVGVARRRALQAGRRLLPRAARRGERAPTPATRVKVWFEGDEGRKDYRSDSFTYEAVSDSNRKVLVVAAEDYTGASPVQTPGPHYLDYYLDALRRQRRRRPTSTTSTPAAAPRRTTSACSATTTRCIWYTGDDVVTRARGLGRGQRRPARARRDPRVPRVHERGRQGALHRRLRRPAVRVRRRGRPAVLRPEGRGPVLHRRGAEPGVRPAALPRALRRAERATWIDDVLEYWFGAYAMAPGDGFDEDGQPVRHRRASTTRSRA